jgi:predicted outer membrane repeat protein
MSTKTVSFGLRFISALMLLIVLVTILGAKPVRATGECHVKAGAIGANNGTSWTDAYTDLQSALGTSSCTEVWVAAGVYTPGTFVSPIAEDRMVTFQLKDGVALYGGYAGVTETLRSQRNPELNVTTLSGDIDNNDSQTPIITDLATVTGNTSNSYHVVTGATGATLDGFTITAGYATEGEGGGMYNYSSSPSVINVTFIGNAASGTFCGSCGGGGMFNMGSSPTLTNVTFDSNSAPRGGGLLNFNGNSPEYDSNPILTNVIFNNNSASGSGGGMDNAGGDPTLTNVTFSDNSSATSCGGGMYNSVGDNPILTNVTFSGNSSARSGGGLYSEGGAPMLTDVTFSDNSAINGGGMASYSSSSPILKNVTFSNNSASGNDGSWFGGGGGGMYNYSGSSPTLTDVTFSGNSTLNYGGGMYNRSNNLTLTNVTFSTNAAFAGGGMLNWSSSPMVTNVTLISNTAEYGGGMSNYMSSNPTLTNVTFTGNSATYNGGGMDNEASSSPLIRNAIFWGNTAPTDPQIYNNSSASVINNSIIQDGCPVGSTCTNITATDPMLGTLGNYGGSTQTIPLQLDSSAIDAGDTATCATTDQRGQARDDLQCDMGAYELQYADSHTVALAPGATMRTYGPTRIGVQVTAGDPGVITVTKSTSWMTPPTNAILASWAITPTNPSDWTATLELCWLPSELNGQTAANLQFWRKSGTTWTSFTPTNIDAGAGCATLAGVTGFSTWTLGGTSQPNAVTLRNLTATTNVSSGFIGMAFAVLAVPSAVLVVRRMKRKTLS